MLYLVSTSLNPYFNIASEEHLLRNFTNDIFMLYRNNPSIVVGKHQNVFAEINYKYARANNIDVVRRLSGGGTVFHDTGNLNFTFIQNSREGSQVDFVKFTEPILQALLKLGVPASRSGRNDLLANGLKISGNAEHVYKNRTLHHGTLLFSSELDKLREGLKVNQTVFTDKAVRSVKSKVVNISEFIPGVMLNEFTDAIISEVRRFYPEGTDYSLNEKDVANINQLMAEKYQTWEWNFAYSPRFKVVREGIFRDSPLSVQLFVEKGMIVQIETSGTDAPNFNFILNYPYREEALQPVLLNYFNQTLCIEILELLF